MTYKIYEYDRFGGKTEYAVWKTYANGAGEIVKVFKTRKGAENWIAKHTW